MAEPIVPEVMGQLLVVTLNAPHVRNAISPEMRTLLLECLRKANEDVSCRAIVLAGAEGNFCSGGRLGGDGKDVPKPDVERTRRNIAVLQDIVRLLGGGAKPTIAAVEGYAYGAGLSLAAACDIVIASESARFCASFGKVGLMGDAGLLWTLPRRVGESRSREMLLTGRVVEAEEAFNIGLANQLVGKGAALDAALEAGKAFEHIAPLSISSTKRILAQGHGSLEAVLAEEADAQALLTQTKDYAEGRLAFKGRRAPEFRGL